MVKKDKQCILCPYKKEEDCLYNHDKCYSLSNIYHGYICKAFPFKQINHLMFELSYAKENKYLEEMDKKYGDSALENDDMKFIWGIKSFDDLSGCDCNIYTMNDIDIIYDKKSNKYILDIETAYTFDDYKAECNYLKECLNAFNKYMDDNNLDRNYKFNLFFNRPIIDNSAKSIEELYTNFKMFVDGFCKQNEE